jgi:nicotinamide-nucleotide amidase
MTNKIALLAQELGERLLKLKWQCVTAESCTGGGLAYRITSVPGSSAWFERGFVTYSNQAKHDLLKVKNETLTNFGAVSEETVREMAQGALIKSQSQISVAITGIAGPGGGSIDKPLGTVWIGTAVNQDEIITKHYLFQGNRDAIRQQSIIAALKQLLNSIYLFDKT